MSLQRYLKSLFFLAFVVAGFWAPFAALFYKHVLVRPDGTPADDLIGWLYFFMPLVGLAANIPAGVAADKRGSGHRLIAWFCVVAALATFAIGLAGTAWGMSVPLWVRFVWIFAAVMLFSAGNMPIVPTVDAETMRFLHRANRREVYGIFRVWGTLGWSVACIAMGALLHLTDYLPWVFWGTSLALLALGATAALRRTASQRPAVHIPWNHLWTDIPFVAFLLFSLLMGATHSASFIYTSYFFDNVLASPWEMGLVFGTWTIFEIPVMLGSNRLLRRFGNRWLIVAGLLLNGVRLWWFSTFTLETPFVWKWTAATLQGAGFGLTHLGTIDYIDRRAPRALKATYMNTANLIRFPIASAIGGKLGALLIAAYGSAALMAICAVASGVLAVVFAAATSRWRRAH